MKVESVKQIFFWHSRIANHFFQKQTYKATFYTSIGGNKLCFNQISEANFLLWQIYRPQHNIDMQKDIRQHIMREQPFDIYRGVQKVTFFLAFWRSKLFFSKITTLCRIFFYKLQVKNKLFLWQNIGSKPFFPPRGLASNPRICWSTSVVTDLQWVAEQDIPVC